MAEANNHEQVEMNVDREIRLVEVEELMSTFKSKTDIYKLLTKNRKQDTH